jgi:hypothetical protein
MNMQGGNVFHKNSYSLGAAHVLLGHVIAPMFELFEQHTPWEVIAESGQLVVAFGGLALKNAQVNAGGVGRHTAFDEMKRPMRAACASSTSARSRTTSRRSCAGMAADPAEQRHRDDAWPRAYAGRREAP